jgi:hypothetical protein
MDALKMATSRIYSEIRNLQKICKHVNAEKIPNSDTGNWDRGQDSYWYDCSCPDCDKRWMEDQK